MALTPMMRQYLETKEKYKDCILFYRLGDFYEMFFDDALTVSKALDLVLTGRECGLSERAPMCGVPHHSAEGYIAKLIELGYKVAICEQLSPPDGKNLVNRDVVKIVTPGTVTEETMLSEDKNNFIACVYLYKDQIGLAWTDITTGEFFVTQFAVSSDFAALTDYLTAISAAEIICNGAMSFKAGEIKAVKNGLLTPFNVYYDDMFDYAIAKEKVLQQFDAQILEKCGCMDAVCAVTAAGALLAYLQETQKRALAHINGINYIAGGRFMMLDANTRRNLELTKTMRDGKKYGSLLWLVGNTSTGMGARNTYDWIEKPLTDKAEISARHQAVEDFIQNPIMRQDVKQYLSSIRDLERLAARVGYGNITPKDCAQIRQSLMQLPPLKQSLLAAKSSKLKELTSKIYTLDDVCDMLNRALSDNPPQVLKDGGFIKPGFNAELDKIRSASIGGKQWLAQLEASERQKTGIKNLKIGFNKIFGYYIEVTKSYLELVPINYTRKQTLAGSERYITEELKKTEESILGAEEKSQVLEIKLFTEITQTVAEHISKLQSTARAVAEIDTLIAFSDTAIKHNYCRPEMLERGCPLNIKDGRHPVVEVLTKNNEFVSNDTYLDNADDRFMIITGPNMAGKSTYMRQVALITLMAHIGSFVPASVAQIPITDKIFTRVGATDNLAFDQSTFMVEMTEVANILQNATKDSLLILDEVGRGTSTFDGLSIAWAVTEYIAKKIKARTMFATHYHELTELEGTLEGVKNYGISVKEIGGTIVFLRKIVRGGAHKSFGIEVAALAGLPKTVLERSKKLLKQLEEADINNPKNKAAQFKMEIPLLSAQEDDLAAKVNSQYKVIIDTLTEINTESLSPIQALNMLHELSLKVKNQG